MGITSHVQDHDYENNYGYENTSVVQLFDKKESLEVAKKKKRLCEIAS